MSRYKVNCRFSELIVTVFAVDDWFVNQKSTLSWVWQIGIKSTRSELQDTDIDFGKSNILYWNLKLW